MLRLSNGDGITSARACVSSASRTASLTNPSALIERMLRDRHRRRAGHHQLHLPPLIGVAEEVADERLASFVRIDAPEVEDERIGEPEPVERREIRAARRRIQTAANHRRRPAGRRAHRHQRFLFRRQEQETPRQIEERAQRVDVDQRILLRRRHEHGAVRDQRQAEVRVA